MIRKMSVDALTAVRPWVYAVLLLGFAGTGAELALMHHYEDIWQVVPLALIAGALVTLISLRWGRRPVILQLFRVLMMLCIAAGGLGIALHFKGAAEFQLEMDPAQPAWALTQKVMRAKAPPVLAPGLMAQLGLLGLIFSYRHPSEPVRNRS